MYCEKCGREIPDGIRFCESCTRGGEYNNYISPQLNAQEQPYVTQEQPFVAQKQSYDTNEVESEFRTTGGGFGLFLLEILAGIILTIFGFVELSKSKGPYTYTPPYTDHELLVLLFIIVGFAIIFNGWGNCCRKR